MSNYIDCAVVGHCPICSQGRQLIMRAKSNGDFFVYCEECESRWASPMEAKHSNQVLLPWSTVASEPVSVDELCGHPWFSYVINR
jgi:hypothetical protein